MSILIRRVIAALHIATAMCLLVPQGASARNSFDSALFAPIELTKSVEQRPDAKSLTDAQKRNLIATRRVLIEFLRSLGRRDADPMAYVTPELRQKYGTRAQLYREAFGQEAYTAARVFDFAFGDHHEILTLRFFLTGVKEGMECTHQRQFSFVRKTDGWKISRID